MAKKYYWLKLQKDFFKKHHIKIIENMTNGTDYILFYMKLLVESISHEGRLRFSDRVPYNDDMLATITGTNIDIVRSAVKIFTELELMTMEDDGTIFMAETYKMMGVETEWAEKKRIYRDTIKGQKKTLSDKSKSLELEKELDIEKDKDIKKPKKHKNGEYNHVLLTEKEYEKLIVDFTNFGSMITNLDEYIETTGKVYKNHNLVMRKWEKNKPENKPEQKLMTAKENVAMLDKKYGVTRNDS